MEAKVLDRARAALPPRLARRITPNRLTFVGLFFGALMAFLALGAVLPVIPRYVMGPLGAGDVAVGVAIGAFSLTAVVSRPIAGRLTDSRGRRAVVLVGALLAGLAGALYFLPAGLAGLLAARLVLGCGEACLFTAGLTWTADIAPRHGRGRSLGLFGLSIWSAMSLGPVIGEGLMAAGGYQAVWAFATLSPLAGAFVITRLSDSPLSAPRASRRPWVARESLAPGSSLALASVGYAALAGFIVLHLAGRGAGHGAAVFAAFAFAVVGQRLLAGRLPDRIGPRRTAVGAACAEAAGLALIAMATSVPVAVVGALVMGTGFSLMYPSLALMVVDAAGDDRRGSALGGFTAFFDIGFGLGAPLVGAIASVSSYTAGFWAAAGLALAGGVLTAAGARGARRAPAPA